MIKVFVFAILMSTSVFSAERCIPNKEKIKICQDFVQNVVYPAYYQDPTVTEKEFPSRFIIDEKKAIFFLNSYDPTKLSIVENKCIQENITKDCITPKVEDGPFGCEYLFPVIQYFRGIQRGLKLNKWSESTKKLAEQVMQKHVNHMLSTKSGLGNVTISFNIIRNAQADGYLKGVYKDAAPFDIEGQKLSEEKIGKVLRSAKKPYSCELLTQLIRDENEINDRLMKKWKAN